jgi:hypothetical protein
MKEIKRIMIVMCIALLVSCTVKAKEDPTLNQQIPVIAENSEEEIIKNIVNEYKKKGGYEVLSLKKANFGIPGGDNWLAESTNIGTSKKYTNIGVYSIKSNAVQAYYNFGINNIMELHSNFNIMGDIPGIRIGRGCMSLGDFNGDGIDEIFGYGFGGNGNFIISIGYDPVKDDIAYYCNIPFSLIDKENGPAPLQFTTYQGRDGFKVYYYASSVASGPSGQRDPPDPNNEQWVFYSWDKEQKKFVERGIMDE